MNEMPTFNDGESENEDFLKDHGLRMPDEKEMAPEMLTTKQRGLSFSREHNLDWMEAVGEGLPWMKNPIEYLSKIENVEEDFSKELYQNGEYVDSKGKEVRNLTPEDIKGVRNYTIHFKDGRWSKAGTAMLRLNRGLRAKFSESQWVLDAFASHSQAQNGIHTSGKTPDGAPLDPQWGDMIRRQVLVSQTIKHILENEEEASDSQDRINREIEEGRDDSMFKGMD